MNVRQALAIAAASVVVALDGGLAASIHEARSQAEHEFATVVTSFGYGFEATPDGLCVERVSMPR